MGTDPMTIYHAARTTRKFWRQTQAAIASGQGESKFEAPVQELANACIEAGSLDIDELVSGFIDSLYGQPLRFSDHAPLLRLLLLAVLKIGQAGIEPAK